MDVQKQSSQGGPSDLLPSALHALFREIRNAPPSAWATVPGKHKRSWKNHAKWFRTFRSRDFVHSDGHALYLLHQRLRLFRGGEADKRSWRELTENQKEKYRKRARRLRVLLGLQDELSEAA